MKDRWRSANKPDVLGCLLFVSFCAACAHSQPYVVASGRTSPGSNSTDGILKLPQVLSWSATKLTTKFYGSHVSLKLSTAPCGMDCSSQFRSLYLPLEVNLVGPLNASRTCLVGLPALPCIVQELPLGNYSLAIRKVSKAFDCLCHYLRPDNFRNLP